MARVRRALDGTSAPRGAERILAEVDSKSVLVDLLRRRYAGAQRGSLHVHRRPHLAPHTTRIEGGEKDDKGEDTAIPVLHWTVPGGVPEAVLAESEVVARTRDSVSISNFEQVI